MVWATEWLSGLLGALTPAQWDAWRNTLATVGGLVALFIAIRTYRHNVQLKSEEQARKVYAELLEVGDGKVGAYISQPDTLIQVHPEVGKWEHTGAKEWSFTAAAPWRHYKYAVTNGSDEIIGSVRFMEQHRYKDGSHVVVSKTLMFLKPGARAEFESIVPGSPSNMPSSLFILTFRDSGGRWWSREGIQAIRPTREPTSPRSWQLRSRWRRWRNHRDFEENRKKLVGRK